MRNCRTKTGSEQHSREAFTIVEVVVALIIIALICSSVLVVIKQGMITLGESRLRMEAFEIARQNMENLLTASSISEMDDYGTSETNPNIEWETVVEPFSDSGTDRMWVRAVCSATYPDANGQPQTIELTHWLTDVPDSVMKQILNDQEKLNDMNEPNMPDANGLPDMLQNQEGTQIDPALNTTVDQLMKE
jgi:type II secretory pathway pseudopilin PulG